MGIKIQFSTIGRGYRQIGRFPILKQDKHVRKRPEFTASGNAGREISRGFRAISRGFAK